MKIYSSILFAIILLSACNKIIKENNTKMKINWNTLSEMPPARGETTQYGLAGLLAGVIDDRMVAAGGSNFADSKPWLGGTKLYYDDIFVLNSAENGSLQWEQPKLKLPAKMAYSACVSAEDAIYCLGGEDATQPLKSALKIYFENNRFKIEELPELAVAVSNAGAAIIGTKLYLAGGNDSVDATKHFQMIDLSKPENGWTVLPDLLVAESHAVVASQSDGTEDCIYVLGGRNKTGEISTFLSSIQKYSPKDNRWTEAGVLQLEASEKFGLSAGTGLAFGAQRILLFGGDKGAIFNRTERFNNAIAAETDTTKREKIIAEKIESLTNHPGFNSEIYSFDTQTGKLWQVGEIPGLSQVTTTAFWWNGKVIIPGGEIRPGVRTPKISEVEITLE
jgi:cyclically-permuted mutarotase family protein